MVAVHNKELEMSENVKSTKDNTRDKNDNDKSMNNDI